MPTVNRANYSTCPSCNRWMHAPLQVLDGNRAVICQECYERADGSTPKPYQQAMKDALLHGIGMLKVEHVDSASVTKPVDARIKVHGYAIAYFDSQKGVSSLQLRPKVYKDIKQAEFEARGLTLNNPFHTWIIVDVGANPARATVKMPNGGETNQLMQKWYGAPSIEAGIRQVIGTFCSMRGLEIEP